MLRGEIKMFSLERVMEFTEPAVREFLTSLVLEALGDNKPQTEMKYGQQRFVKGDPATVTCTWPLGGEAGQRSQEFAVLFSGEAVTNFAEADEGRRARLRALAIESIRAQHRAFDPADKGPYPFLCQIDWLLGK